MHVFCVVFFPKMRLFKSLSLLLVACVGVVYAKSAVGNRVLVVLEDEAQKGLYSKFWADLEGMLRMLTDPGGPWTY